MFLPGCREGKSFACRCIQVPSTHNYHLVLFGWYMCAGEREQCAGILCKGAQAYRPELPLLDLIFCTHERLAQRLSRCSYDMFQDICATHAKRTRDTRVFSQ